MTVTGIDCSRWQSSLPDLSGLGFMFARASSGQGGPDSKYASHIAKARAAGLVVGAYHFNYGSGNVGAQAVQFLDVAGSVDLYVLDVEGKPGITFSQSQTAAFIAEVHKRGKRIGLYHSDSGFFDAGQDFDWVAKWSSTPPARHWDFWQYTSDGHLPGYTGRLDMDRFNGSLADLRALAHPGFPTVPRPQPKLVQTGPPTTERNVMITGTDAPYRFRLVKGQPLFRYPGGPAVTHMSAAGAVEWRGNAGPGWTAVRVKTGAPYADHALRPTELYVPSKAGVRIA